MSMEHWERGTRSAGIQKCHNYAWSTTNRTRNVNDARLGIREVGDRPAEHREVCSFCPQTKNTRLWQEAKKQER